MRRNARSILHRLLTKSARRRDRWPYRLLWWRLFNATRSWSEPIDTIVHGHRVSMGFNYTYPLVCRLFPTFNSPLLELVHESHISLQRSILLIDVGAAVGDTVLLVEANCPSMVAEYVCIDGDAEFFAYLHSNLAALPNCRCIFRQLGRSVRDEASLVRTHGGTASAQGISRTLAVPLDELVREEKIAQVDVLKIDVDGFDGEVLAGAATTLRKQQPAVIFEWHPLLCAQTGKPMLEHFETLEASGYDRLLWFDKFGQFSHFGHVADYNSHRALAHYCTQTKDRPDWHYDVVALAQQSPIDSGRLAELAFARNRRSPC